MGFLKRASTLPSLGLGLSTEYGAGDADGALSPLAMAESHPRFAAFLELGVEVEKGYDTHAQAWIAQGRPTTYHFLDVNLDEDEDFDEAWLTGLRQLIDQARPAWLCGDAGLWHFGPRERGQMLLLPPVLIDESAEAMAHGVAQLRELTGHEVLPENPPGTAFVGDLHLLDYFARVAERADTGLLLDVAHLALYQRVMGHDALVGLDAFPLERVVEVHIAGGKERNTDGFSWVEDTHSVDVLEDTWRIFERVVAGATHLKAIVFECERNAASDVVAGFSRIEDLWPAGPNR